jgi:hypothetical protein
VRFFDKFFGQKKNMTLLDAFAEGVFGLQVTPPEGWEVHNAEVTEASLVDASKAIDWFWFIGPGLHLDLRPQHFEHLRAHAYRIARPMFDAVSRQIGQAEQLRTEDMTWTPMIDFELIEIGQAPALRMVHRMTYQPGLELIMGHVLIPQPAGLVEFRCVTRELGPTGMRESILYAMLPTSNREAVSQEFFDTSEHDEKFPEHVLSRTREALDEMISRIDRAQGPPDFDAHSERAEISGGSLVLPPRVHLSEEGASRVSFCVTDGISRFSMQTTGVAASFSQLEDVAKSELHDLHARAKVENISIETRTLASGRVGAIVTGDGHTGPLRNVFVLFVGEDGDAWHVGLFPDTLTPVEEILGELDDCVESWRPA